MSSNIENFMNPMHELDLVADNSDGTDRERSTHIHPANEMNDWKTHTCGSETDTELGARLPTAMVDVGDNKTELVIGDEVEGDVVASRYRHQGSHSMEPIDQLLNRAGLVINPKNLRTLDHLVPTLNGEKTEMATVVRPFQNLWAK